MPEKPHFYGNFRRFIFIYSEKLRGAKLTANKKVVLTPSNLIIVLSYFHQIRKTRSDRSNCCITTIPNTFYSLILYSYRAKCNITHSPLLQRQGQRACSRMRYILNRSTRNVLHFKKRLNISKWRTSVSISNSAPFPVHYKNFLHICMPPVRW